MIRALVRVRRRIVDVAAGIVPGGNNHHLVELIEQQNRVQKRKYLNENEFKLNFNSKERTKLRLL